MDGLLPNPAIEIAMGRNKQDKAFETRKSGFHELCAALSRPTVGEKDGTCFLQGSLVGGQRIARNVRKTYIILIDVENGITIDEVEKRLRASGYAGFIYTTYSHLKEESEIAESALINFRRRLKDAPADELELIKRYFIEEKGWLPSFVDSIVAYVRDFREGGIKYVVTHAEMHRMRVVLPLAEPFDFAVGASHQERIKEWSELYRATCAHLQIPFDPSCADPSRLMYFPRVPNTVLRDKFETRLVPGNPYDFGTARALAAFANYGGESGRHEFKTPNMRAFLSQHSLNFRPAAMLEALAPDDIRARTGDGKIEYRCPNEENHTEQKQDDRAFWVLDSDGITPWHMGCRHATCISMSKNDRAFFCDKIFVALGITDPLTQLDDFLIEVPEREAPPVMSDVYPGVPDSVVTRIKNIRPNDLHEYDALIKELGALEEGPGSDDACDLLARLAGRSKAEARGHLRAARRRHRAAKKQAEIERKAEERRQREAEQAGGQDDDNPLFGDGTTIDVNTYDGPISLDWFADVQSAVANAQLKRRNEVDPRVFMQSGGLPVYKTGVESEVTFEPILSAGDIAKIFSTFRIRFVRLTDAGVRPGQPTTYVLQMMMGHMHGFPEITRVIKVPVLSTDNTIRTEAGYDPGIKAWIDPPVELEDAPTLDEVDEAALDDAVATLFEAIRDFPFSDAFDGSEHLEIKSDVLDADGFPLPNLERGRASRHVALAMMIQPFVQDYIGTATPAYLIDKSKPGTGAGFLADCVCFPFTGERAKAFALSQQEEEVRKAIMAALLNGSPVNFIDNVRHKITSASLAAVLTSPKWTDRILGQSKTVTVDNRSMWVIAGNDIQMASELVRRIIPLRLDAATANPAADRVVGKDFKHNLSRWLPENRLKMVRAIHVIILNWVKMGCPPPSSGRNLNSFDRWSYVMGGIMEAAGFDTFLTTTDAYRKSEDIEVEEESALISDIYTHFDTDPFEVRDLITVAEAPTSFHAIDMAAWGIDLSRARTSEEKTKVVSMSLSKNFRRGVFAVPDKKDPDKTINVRLLKIKSRPRARYKLELVHKEEVTKQGDPA